MDEVFTITMEHSGEIIMKETTKRITAYFWRLAIPTLVFACLPGCQHTPPASIGMTKQQLMAEKGQPETTWSGKNGIECWKYQPGHAARNIDGTWYVVFHNDKVVKTTMPNRNVNSLTEGLPEQAAREILGPPDNVTAMGGIQLWIYRHRSRTDTLYQYVRIVSGTVESFGDKEEQRQYGRGGVH
jgi:hypothetical protein